MKNNPVGWFEIPVKKMDRAVKFYEKALGYKLERHKMEELDMAWFPMEEDAPQATGTLVYNEDWYTPSHEGILIYFTTPTGDIDQDLKNVEKAGGKVLLGKKSIGEHGFVAFFEDTEGNRIALHSMK